jgi:ferrous iron transport protein B
MATRNIENWKERLITILVTPFTTCSARLPVYAIIIALVIPDERLFGFLNMQGMTLMLLYLLGFEWQFSAYILNKILKIKGKRILLSKCPIINCRFSRTSASMLSKNQSFYFGAGKIILAISIVLWF